MRHFLQLQQMLHADHDTFNLKVSICLNGSIDNCICLCICDARCEGSSGLPHALLGAAAGSCTRYRFPARVPVPVGFAFGCQRSALCTCSGYYLHSSHLQLLRWSGLHSLQLRFHSVSLIFRVKDIIDRYGACHTNVGCACTGNTDDLDIVALSFSRLFPIPAFTRK